MRGRPVPGPEFVQRLQGDAAAKRRMEVVLQTITGALRITGAAKELGISTQRFHTLREEALQAGVDKLTHRPGGRPSKQATPEQQRIAELEQEIAHLRQELEVGRLREEIAAILPGRQGRVEKKRRTSAAD
jgi:transposase-like protein